MRNIVLAPHLDDEVIGCYSIWNKIDIVVYFTKDYRVDTYKRGFLHFTGKVPEYIYKDDFDFNSITDEDTLYIPSKYDFHPLHKVVRNMALGLKGDKMYYSVEMNVPWLEEEKSPENKLALLKLLYPKEDLFIHNAKYYLFHSIKAYDDITFRKLKYSDTIIYLQEFSIVENLQKEMDKISEIMITMKNTISIQNLLNKIQTEIPNRIIKIDSPYKMIE